MNNDDTADCIRRQLHIPPGGDTALATAARALVDQLNNPVILADFFAAGVIALCDIVTASSPVSARTVTAGSGMVNETLYLTPAGTLAALTLAFPSDANSQVGQKLTVFSTAIVTALTVSAAGLTIEGTALAALSANTAYSFQKVAAGTWIRLQ